MTYAINNANPVKTETCTPGTSTAGRPMWRPFVFGLAGAVLALMIVLPNPVLAIQHGCTPPVGGPRNLTIDLDFDGKKSQVSGGFCEAIGKAEAAIAGGRLTKKDKKKALKTLQQLQLQTASKNQTAGRRVKFTLTAKCTATTSKQGCTVGGSISF